MDEEVGEVILKGWSLELVKVRNHDGMVPVVRGRRCDARSAAGSKAYWRTSEIVEAESPTVLRTRTQVVVVLVGPLSDEMATKVGLPHSLVLLFKRGFPIQTWKSDVQKASIEQCAVVPSGDCPIVAYEAPLSGMDWIRSLLSIPQSTSRHKWLPTLRPDPNGAQPFFHAMSDLFAQNGRRAPSLSTTKYESGRSDSQCKSDSESGNGTSTGSTPLGIGDDVQRLFQDGWFVGRLSAAGMDKAGMPSLLIAYRDGLFEILPYALALDACRHMRIRPVELDCTKKDELGKPESRKRPISRSNGSAPSSNAQIHCDGPRRTKQVRKILADNCFGGAQDFFEPVAAAQALTASPGALSFLNSLHTGCTPALKPSLQIAAFDGPQSLQRDGDGCSNTLKDLSNVSWEPTGLDGFISGALVKRSRCTSGHMGDIQRRKRPRHTSEMAGNAAVVACRGELRDNASSLLRKVDDAIAKSLENDFDLEDMSLEESEDELAPVAAIPA